MKKKQKKDDVNHMFTDELAKKIMRDKQRSDSQMRAKNIELKKTNKEHELYEKQTQLKRERDLRRNKELGVQYLEE